MNPWDENKIKFAIPTKGRLKDPAIELLKKSGYSFRTTGRNLYATCLNEDIIFIFVRADDIPVLVDSGVIDIGITGSDLIIERSASVEEILKLNFGKCRLCVAVRDTVQDKNLSYLNGKTIATSFPATTTDYFKNNNVNVKCIEMNGSVEIMIALNLADAIVDLVETGDSLRDNNLKIFSDIGSYQAVLVSNKKLKDDPRIARIKRRIDGILVASQYSMLEYNIKTESLKKAESIAPGFESPTVSALDEKGWAAVKVMVKKSEIVQVMDRLAEIGATAILETEILNCRL
jgi:ATP phosphoribosyltransferase